MRWEKLTGNKAVLDGNGRTFEAIKAERLPPTTPTTPTTENAPTDEAGAGEG
jgi:hypothetical protein